MTSNRISRRVFARVAATLPAAAAAGARAAEKELVSFFRSVDFDFGG